MPLDIFTIFCAEVDIKFVHKCKVVLIWDNEILIGTMKTTIKTQGVLCILV